MRQKLAAYGCEFAGTALVLFWGVTVVSLLWGAGSPVPAMANLVARRFTTALLFVAGVIAVVYSPLGQRSGGHLNPALTVGFWRMGRVPGRDVGAYVASQLLGAVSGVALAAAAWGSLARGVHYAALMPVAGRTWRVTLPVEIAISFALVFLVFVCVNKPRIAAKTGLIVGSFMTMVGAFSTPGTGPGLNPARSLAPAVMVPVFQNQWIYVLGPIAGALAAAGLYQRRFGASTVCAKLYHTPAYPCPFDCGYRLLRAGETVMREGEAGDEAYLVEQGALRVTRGGATLAELGPGAWVGEMSLLLDEPRSATVVAETDAQLRRVTRDSFGRVLAEDPRRTQELVRQLAERVRDASERLAGRV